MTLAILKFIGAILGIIMFAVFIGMVVISGGVKEMFDNLRKK